MTNRTNNGKAAREALDVKTSLFKTLYKFCAIL